MTDVDDITIERFAERRRLLLELAEADGGIAYWRGVLARATTGQLRQIARDALFFEGEAVGNCTARLREIEREIGIVGTLYIPAPKE